MSALGTHAAFIIGSYVMAGIVLGALTVWTLLDHRARSRELAALDPRRGQDRP
jgi:heme exporter protein CcmD